MKRERFERLVTEAVERIPLKFRRALENLAIVVEGEPAAELLDEMAVDPPDTLLGLYQGTPLPDRGWAHGNALPDRVVVFQRPIEDACHDDAAVVVAIGETVIHELGHYFGMSEEEIGEVEERYWRGDVDDL